LGEAAGGSARGWLPDHDGAARDVEDDAGYPGGGAGGEEEGGLGDVFWGGEDDGVRFDEGFFLFVGDALLVPLGEDGLGAMQLTRMPRGPTWAARCWVMSSMAALAAP
jgi:hypothetical protein